MSRTFAQGEPRESSISIRVIDREREEVMEHAKRRRMYMSDHIRDVLLRAARGEIKVDAESQGQLPLC